MQCANLFGGNPCYQATKRHLNNNFVFGSCLRMIAVILVSEFFSFGFAGGVGEGGNGFRVLPTSVAKIYPFCVILFGALEEKKKKRLLGTVNLVGKLTSVASFHLVLVL